MTIHVDGLFGITMKDFVDSASGILSNNLSDIMPLCVLVSYYEYSN